ncbi:hypothetical protein PMI14_01632 [Acidovorax sp. CF316]|uniref:hypothetical protein n=1 Tax=Acidovorax sp. CF316 TaxID=1144317 RepID=UPI00026BD322|nr:hypothetical protein [Acidovorax sp. CF316]EJE53686.1 hypothetical protein PMI14_01632 [Acidovorax sp. CF316]
MHRWKTPLLCSLACVAVTALWMPPPGWWAPPLSRTLPAITWLQVAQGIGVLAAALPSAAVDFIKWLCVLPLLTWLLLKVQPRPPAAPPVAFAG